MSKPNALKALDPLEFRFTDPEDVQKYGDGWFTYDEASFLRLRARDLMALEGEIGTPMVAVMNGMRSSTTLGDTVAAWLGVRARNADLAGPFDDFNPITNLLEWRDPSEGKDPAPEVGPDPDQPLRSSNTISAPTATVVLPNLPVAE